MDFLITNKGPLLLAMAVGLLTFFMMRTWNRRFRKSTAGDRNQPLFPRRTRETKPQQPLLDAPPDITRWQVEMHDLARDLKGELDTKIAVLERLVIDARQEADRLEAMVERAEKIDTTSTPR